MRETLANRKVLVEQRDAIGYSEDVYDVADVPDEVAAMLEEGRTDVTLQPDLPDEDDESSFYRARLLPEGFAGYRLDVARATLVAGS